MRKPRPAAVSEPQRILTSEVDAEDEIEAEALRPFARALIELALQVLEENSEETKEEAA